MYVTKYVKNGHDKRNLILEPKTVFSSDKAFGGLWVIKPRAYLDLSLQFRFVNTN